VAIRESSITPLVYNDRGDILEPELRNTKTYKISKSILQLENINTL
jgi:hypothetical protein